MNKLPSSLYALLARKINDYNHNKYIKLFKNKDDSYSFIKACNAIDDRNKLYAYFSYYFANKCPSWLTDHRAYITREKKGFGEDAFHAMWWSLINEYRPRTLLEIGVYRGQVISLWKLICKHERYDCDVNGISPFSSAGDSVSDYNDGIDYYLDVLQTFDEFNLGHPTLVKAYSNEPAAINHIQSQKWDLIYIDGGHEYEDVLSDYFLCVDNLSDNGILVLDDSSLYTNYRPPSHSFAGHLGPSKVARDYADKQMTFIGAVGHNNVYKNNK